MGLVTGISAGSTTITYTDINGCQRTAVVMINALPSTSSITGPINVCASSSGTIYSVLNSVGSTYNWSISGGLQTSGTTTNSVTVNWDASPTGSLDVTETSAAGCIGSLVSLGVTKSVCNVDVTIVNPSFSLCRGATSGNLLYSGTVGSPDAFRLDFDMTAKNQGFVDVPFAASNLSGSPISIVIPAGAAPGSYSASLTVRNTGNSFQSPSYPITITINPIPVLSSTVAPPAICSGTSFNYTASSATAGSTFAWSRAFVAGISQAANSGTGDVAETLTNTTAAPISVIYQYTTTANSCSSGIQNVVVVVNPVPILSGTLAPPAICSGTSFNYIATSATSLSSFSWSRALDSGISQLANSGSGNVNEVLTNTTSTPITVTYQYTTSANGCSSGGQSVAVVVNPIPVLSSTLAPAAICSGAIFNYVPSSATVSTFSWVRAFVSGISQSANSGTGNVNETLTNTTTAPINVTYQYTTTANGCSGVQNVVVVVNPIPVLSSTLVPSAICSGTTFSYTAMSTTAGSGFSWSRAIVSGISEGVGSGTDNVSETLTNTTTAAISVTYEYTTTANSCSSGIQNVVVVVNPSPVLSSTLSPSAICSGTIFSYLSTSATSGSTFNWSRAPVGGISQGASTGTGNVNETLTNVTTAPIIVTYQYTTTANGCSGSIQNVAVVVNPIPALSSTLTPSAICSGSIFDYTASSATAGSTFAWSRAFVVGISQAANSGTSDVMETLTNTTTAPISVTYQYTTTANSCSSGIQNVVVVVNPIPVLSSTLTPAAICSGTTFSYTAASATVGSTFSWTRALVADISQLANSGTGNVSEALTNTTAAPISVTYQYTTTANGCSSGIQSVVVVVNPIPVLSSTLIPAAICSGTNFSYTATSATPVSSFSWSRAPVVGISQLANSGTGDVNETLTNTTTNPISVTYQYTTTANGCSSNIQNVVIVVNPIPVLSSTLTPAAICSGTTFNYTTTSATAGSGFSWTRAVVSGVTEGANSGAGNVSETLTNTTTAPISVTYHYTTAANGCSSSIQNVVVVVNPIPVLSSDLNPAAICSGTILSYSPTSATLGSTFSWSRAFVAGISQAASAGLNNVNETLTNTTVAPISVTYQYVTTANGCSNAFQNVVVVVNPTPTLSSTLSPVAICSGTTFNYIATSNTSGSSFSWTRAVVNGISQLANSGIANVSETLTNTTAAPISVTYLYTTSANGCSIGSQSVVVLVNPTPGLGSTLSPSAICSEATFTYVANSATSGSSFTWIRPTIVGIDEAASSGTTSIVNEVLTNSTDAPISVTYQFTTSANSCTGLVQNVVVVVNPTPALSSTLTPLAICSGTTFNYSATSATVGSTFTWSRVFLSGISQLANSGSGNINEVLANTTTAPINVTYQYIATANGCTGSTQNVVVVVNPIPVLNSSFVPSAICSGTTFNYTATSATVGSTFSWSRGLVVGISQSPDTGAGNVVEELTNTTSAPISVTYQFTTTANGCSSGLQNISVIVNHTPVVNLPTNREVCNGADSPSISFSGTGSNYQWTNSNTLIGLAVTSGDGTIPLFNASNDGNSPLVSTVSVTPEFTGSGITCLGSPANFNITVHPTPSLAVSDAAPVICNGLASNIILTNSNNIPGTTTFNWTTLNANNLSGATSSFGTAIVQTLTSIDGINSGTVVYRIVATSAFGCQNSPTFVPAAVLPPPNFSLSNTTPVICDRGRVDVLISSNVSNAQVRVKDVQYAGVSGGLTVGSLFVNNQKISEALFNNTTAPITVTYSLEAIVGACPASPEKVTTVLVNPTPVFTINNSNSSQCSGSSTDIVLSSPTTNSTIKLDAISYNGVTGGTSAVGSIFNSGQSIQETLTNNGSLPANVFYTFSANASGCSSVNSQTTSVLVNPNPTFSLTNGAINICSSSSTNILFSSSVSGAQISLKSVNYGSVVGSLSPGALFVNGQKLAETLLNTTNAPITVVYEFVASVGLCGPSASTFTSVTVAPNPVITIINSSLIICSGDATNISINSLTVGSVITLTAVNYNGISGTRNVGDTFVNGGSITEALTNVTNTSVTVTYSFSVSATGCTNPAVQTISVIVNPVPTFQVSNSSTSICSGSRANILFSSTVLGAQIRLKSINYGAATGTLSAGALFTNGQSITNFLFNNSNSPATVVFEFEGFVGTCLNSTLQTASVIVNPNPTFAAVPNATTVCSGSPVSIQFSSPTSGHQINLVGVNYGLVSGGGLIAGTSVFFDGNSVSETLINNSNSQVTVTYVFNVTTPGSIPSCPINPVNSAISITVEPAPRFTVSNSVAQLCSGNQTSITLSTPVTGAQMRLKAVNYGGVIGSITYPSGTVFANNSTITEVLQNPVLADRLVEYSFEAQVGSCAVSAAQIASVTVSQAPSLILTNNASSICTGSSTDFQVRSNNSNPVITLSSVNYNGVSGGKQSVGAIYSSGQVINEVLQNTTNLPIAVVYSFTVSASGCTGNSASSISVVVNPLPLVSFSGLIDQVADNDPLFEVTGNQNGGLFSVTPVTTVLGKPTTGLTDEVSINPSLLTIGINTLKYTYKDGNGCTNFISQAFSVVRSTAIDFIVNGFTSNTNGEFEVCANIGRVRLVGSPSLSEGVAPDTKFSGPGRLVFFDGKDYFLDTDGAVSGTYSIRYDFKNSVNATTSRTRTVKILASPVASIEASNSCITDDIPFKDLSTINTTPFPSTLSAWKWEFGDGTQSLLQNPSNKFPIASPGVKTISLTVTTTQGCSNKTSKTIRVGPKPTVDFDWSAVCDQDVTTFKSNSSVEFSTINDYSWDFGDGKTAVGASLSSTQNKYPGPKVYTAKLSVKTDDGCTSAISKKVFILPFKSITANQTYFEDFEATNGNWTPVSIEPNSDTSWRWSNPSGKTISKLNPRALTSTKAWWTGKFYPTTTTYGINEKSAVNGPCLNISSLKRPMIAFDYFVDTQTNIDGVVLQYFNNTEGKWLNLGVKDEGVSWYNATGITSNPGSQEFLRAGWTGNNSKEWSNARFNLDTIPVSQRGKVAIRIAFSSDGSNPTIAGNTYDGFAFDNVFIGEKQRNVLVERFTNSSLKVYVDEDAYVSNLYDNQIKLRNDDPASSNFNFIQYHINFPGLDSLNFYNPNDPAARAAFFSITQPTTIADGATDNKFRPSTAGAKPYLDARSLIDPQFDLSLSAKQGTAQNKISFDLTVTRKASFTGATTLLLYVALVENNVVVKSKTGQFRNVLRKQLLGGDGVTRIWTANQPFIKESFIDIPLLDCKINNPKNLWLIAYVQDKNTKEIYQSAIIQSPEVKCFPVTGIEEAGLNETLEVYIYPNPANRIVKFEFNQQVSEEFEFKIFDQRGVEVLGERLNSRSGKFDDIDVSKLSNGVYQVVVTGSNNIKIYKKLVVLNSN